MFRWGIRVVFAAFVSLDACAAGFGGAVLLACWQDDATTRLLGRSPGMPPGPRRRRRGRLRLSERACLLVCYASRRRSWTRACIRWTSSSSQQAAGLETSLVLVSVLLPPPSRPRSRSPSSPPISPARGII
ncbi:uncharacterized protein BKA78DRAFT_323336 [Phyllosticta capitalensis]|uniref:uncharacterized protein n=1 Tax=Phyllosticta capitalensis TaxID=121624 RepID=UPI00312E8011